MAVLKQNEAKVARYVKKETILNQELWGKISSYIKYAEIKGSQVDKRNFVVAGALEHLFNNDKGFQEYLNKSTEVKSTKVETEVKPQSHIKK